MSSMREVATMPYVAVTQPPPQEWPPQGQWTYDDYARLPNDGWKYEVMRGELYMSPASRPRHQRSLLRLSAEMERFVSQRQLGEVYISPIDVILPRNLGTPVQPDILFIRRDNLGIIGETTIDGVPDLVVEILSPSNWIDDRRTKFSVYAEASIGEYWIIDTRAITVEIYQLVDGRYEIVDSYGSGDTVASLVLDGFSIAVDEIIPQ
jgi:Uma2 family endonuclease